MRRTWVLGAGLTVVLCWAAQPRMDAAEAPVDQLIARLGSKSFAEREAAAKGLDAVGAAALGPLREASNHDHLEIRRRAARLVAQIERRGESARLLMPRTVRLSYSNTPLVSAVADLKKQTGFDIRLDGEPSRWAGRKVTLDVGPINFWEGLHLFCRAAGVKEVAPPAPPRKAAGVTGSIVIIGGGVKAMPTDVTKPSDKEPTTSIVLGDGAPAATPVSFAGSLRVTALPATTPLPNVAKQAGETLVPLGIVSEPTMQWREIVGVAVERAVDEHGRLLRQRWLPAKVPVPPSSNQGMVIINGQVITPPSEKSAEPALVPVALRVPDGKSTILKELRGTLTGFAVGAPEPLVAIDDILKAGGKSFRGARHGVVRVAEVTQKLDQLIVRLDVAPPRRKLDGGPAVAGNQTIIVNGQVISGPQRTLSGVNFSLFDKQGKPLALVRALNTGGGADGGEQLELVFRVPSPPARLVYSDRPSAIIDVPFLLKDVPLR